MGANEANLNANFSANEANLGANLNASKANPDLNAQEIKANPKTNAKFMGTSAQSPDANSANEANLNANLRANEANLGANEANPRANLNANGANPNANPRASQRELEGSIDFSKLEKSDFTPNFTQVSEAKQTFPYNAFLDIENSLAQELKLPNTQIKASLEYLRAHHPEMFSSKREVYSAIKALIKDNNYRGDGLKNPNSAYIANFDDNIISDMAINRDSGGVFHLNKDRKISKLEKEKLLSAVGTPIPQHKQLVLGAQMNTSKEHFSPTNGEILPQKSDFTPNFTQENKIVGNGFVAKDGDLIFLDEAKFDLSKSLQNKSGLNERVNASLAWLQSRHPEMFKNKIAVKKVIDYVLDDPSIIKSAKNENNIFMGKMNGEKMNDIVINKDESKIIHTNTRKPNAKEKADSEDALHSHSDTLPDGALMLAEKPRLSANGEILPQNADNFAQNLNQSAQNLSNSNLSGDLPNANLNAPNLPNANFHNPRAEFSANNAYENFSNPNNPRFMGGGGGGGENPRFISASQNPRANAREQEERTGFFNQNGEHLGAKETALMNGSVDFTHLKKADFPPSSSANLAFENSNDVLTWRAQSANIGENLKPNSANTARTNEAQNGANLGADSANEGAIPQELVQGSVNFNTLKKVDFTPSKTSTKNGEISADKNAFNKLENEKFEAIKNEQKRREDIKLKAQEADLRAQQEAQARQTNLNSPNLGVNQGRFKSKR